MLSEKQPKKLETSTIEFYIGLVIAIITVVFPMTWWFRCLLLLVLIGICADVSFRHPRLISRHIALKIAICLIVIVIIVTVAWHPLREEYKEETGVTVAKKQEVTITPKPELLSPQSTLQPTPQPTPAPQKRHKAISSVAPQQKPYDLTEAKRKNFLGLLQRSQSETRDILKIGCTSSSEIPCVTAGKFLILFSQAGWEIDSKQVFRMEQGIPIEGVTMFSSVDAASAARAQNLPPHLGIWQQMDKNQQAIYWAFRGIGVPVNFSMDQSLPKGTLGIYFGPEPR